MKQLHATFEDPVETKVPITVIPLMSDPATDPRSVAYVSEYGLLYRNAFADDYHAIDLREEWV